MKRVRAPAPADGTPESLPRMLRAGDLAEVPDPQPGPALSAGPEASTGSPSSRREPKSSRTARSHVGGPLHVHQRLQARLEEDPRQQLLVEGPQGWHPRWAQPEGPGPALSIHRPFPGTQSYTANVSRRLPSLAHVSVRWP